MRETDLPPDPDPTLPPDFAVDMELRMVQAGGSLRQLIPELAVPGTRIDTVLKIRHPRCTSWDLEHLIRFQGSSKVVLKSVRGGVELRGGLFKVRQMRRDAEGELKEDEDVVL